MALLDSPNMFSKRQLLAYNQAELETAYTYEQIIALMFLEQQEGSNDWAGLEECGADLRGLCEFGLFTPSDKGQGDPTLIADWRFTKVEEPEIPDPPAAAHAWVLPIPHQGVTPTGVFPVVE